MRLSYHPEAVAELVEAARFYERKLPGLGKRFRAEVDTAAARVLETPDRWRVVEKDRVEGEVVRVLAVKHHSRHPDYWKERG